MKTISAERMEAPTWELSAIKYADSMLPEKMAFAGGREDVSHPIVFVIYCIRIKDKVILIDPGCDALPGFKMENFIQPVDALAQAGIQPESVTDIIITHAHHDHIDAVRHFPGSTVHIQKEEYAAGRQYIPEECLVNIFEDGTVIADCVRVQRIGGHTKGSCIISLPDGSTTWVLCGDACYFRENLTRQIPIGTSKDIEKSKAFLREFAQEKYKVLICHDPQNFREEFANGSIVGI